MRILHLAHHGNQLRFAGNTHLFIDASCMTLDRILGNAKLFCQFLGCVAFAQKLYDLDFPHRNTLDYIDSLLAETDRKMSELINNIRLERNEIRNRR